MKFWPGMGGAGKYHLSLGGTRNLLKRLENGGDGNHTQNFFRISPNFKVLTIQISLFALLVIQIRGCSNIARSSDGEGGGLPNDHKRSRRGGGGSPKWSQMITRSRGGVTHPSPPLRPIPKALYLHPQQIGGTTFFGSSISLIPFLGSSISTPYPPLDHGVGGLPKWSQMITWGGGGYPNDRKWSSGGGRGSERGRNMIARYLNSP